MLISNRGLFWKREDVFWGKKNNRGRLLGRQQTKKRAQLVDFWNQIGVYALYADFRLVYVGQVRSVKEGFGKRLKRHADSDELSGRWDSFSWFGIRDARPRIRKNPPIVEPEPADPKKSSATEELLNILEGIAIEIAEPPLNAQGGRFAKSAKVFLQERDTEKLGRTQSDALEQVLEGIKKLQKKGKGK